MNGTTLQLVNDLELFPEIKERLQIMLSVAKNIDGSYELADDVEDKICDEINKMGCALISAWAVEQEKQKAIAACAKNSDLVKHSKKNFIGTQSSGKVALLESTFTQQDGLLIRPFSSSAQVKCRAYSTPLQRVVVDFASDVSFEDASKKIKQHYGIDVPSSSIRIITEKHATAIHNNFDAIQTEPQQGQETIISLIDGSMVPIVETDQNSEEDARKTRKTKWEECRLAAAYPKGSATPIFGVTFDGVDEAGKQLKKTVELAGCTDTSKVHALGDGATWIADQVEKVFGDQAKFLVDFYHVAQYIHAAAQYCHPEDPNAWATIQKKRMKNGEYLMVIQELKNYINIHEVSEDKKCPVNICYNYMIKRTNCFNYKDAIANDLPIGSGEIESAHRSVIQKRLKLPGGWWLRENAKSMASLRVARANNLMGNYWAQYRMSECSIN